MSEVDSTRLKWLNTTTNLLQQQSSPKWFPKYHVMATPVTAIDHAGKDGGLIDSLETIISGMVCMYVTLPRTNERANDGIAIIFPTLCAHHRWLIEDKFRCGRVRHDSFSIFDEKHRSIYREEWNGTMIKVVWCGISWLSLKSTSISIASTWCELWLSTSWEEGQILLRVQSNGLKIVNKYIGIENFGGAWCEASKDQTLGLELPRPLDLVSHSVKSP